MVDRITPNVNHAPRNNRFSYADNEAQLVTAGEEARLNGPPEEIREPPRSRIERFTFAELRDRYPDLHPPVVDGLFREQEIANVIAPSKLHKSWLMYDLALCIITGQPWLGRFPTSPGPVLLIDNELHRPTIQYRIHEVAEAMGLRPDEYEHDLEIWPLRGNLRSLVDLGVEFDRIKPGTFKNVILDAKYRFAVPGNSENDNAMETQIYNLLDSYAMRTRAAFTPVGHSSKGNQSDKRITDVGAGAGAQSRAADCHLILREHDDPECAVVDAVVRSFAPVESLVLRWKFPLWTPDGDMDPAELKGMKTKAEEKREAEDRKGMLDVANTLLKWNREEDGPATPNRITDKVPYGRDKTRNLLSKLLHQGTVISKPINHRGNPTDEYYLTDTTEI